MGFSKEDKETARRALRVKRQEAHAQNADNAAARLRDVFMSNVFCEQGLLIASYMPQGSEMDPAPLLQALEAKGHKFCLPCTAESSKHLLFRAYNLGDALRLGKKDIPEPDVHAPVVFPDMMLVPLVGFDRMGHRLGQGGGYYDRTLHWHRSIKKVIAIGVAYAVQELELLPFDAQDALLDAVVTEQAYVSVAAARE